MVKIVQREETIDVYSGNRRVAYWEPMTTTLFGFDYSGFAVEICICDQNQITSKYLEWKNK